MSGRRIAVPHVGVYVERAQSGCDHPNCVRERIFAEEWQKFNDDHAEFSRWGVDILDTITAKPCARGTRGAWDDGITVDGWQRTADVLGEPHHMTDRDRAVAATVVQFMGTSGGIEFLARCLDRAGYTLISPQGITMTTTRSGE
jgi:hypothetical protein